MSETYQNIDEKELVSREYELVNSKGLHARAAALFVLATQNYDCITVSKLNSDGTYEGPVRGHSVMELLMLAAPKGSKIVVDAPEEAHSQLEKVIREDFFKVD